MLFLNSKINLPLMPLSLLGSALVVLISFRNRSVYNRWWEARTLWGRWSIIPVALRGKY